MTQTKPKHRYQTPKAVVIKRKKKKPDKRDWGGRYRGGERGNFEKGKSKKRRKAR